MGVDAGFDGSHEAVTGRPGGGRGRRALRRPARQLAQPLAGHSLSHAHGRQRRIVGHDPHRPGHDPRPGGQPSGPVGGARWRRQHLRRRGVPGQPDALHGARARRRRPAGAPGTLFARIADAVAVRVGLVGVGDVGAVVDVVGSRPVTSAGRNSCRSWLTWWSRRSRPLPDSRRDGGRHGHAPCRSSSAPGWTGARSEGAAIRQQPLTWIVPKTSLCGRRAQLRARSGARDAGAPSQFGGGGNGGATALNRLPGKLCRVYASSSSRKASP